jgi:hypothetical protein
MLLERDGWMHKRIAAAAHERAHGFTSVAGGTHRPNRLLIFPRFSPPLMTSLANTAPERTASTASRRSVVSMHRKIVVDSFQDEGGTVLVLCSHCGVFCFEMVSDRRLLMQLIKPSV